MTNKVRDLAGHAALLILLLEMWHLTTGVIVSKRLIVALSLSVLVTACGGGGGGSNLTAPLGGGTAGGGVTDPCGVTAQIDFVEEVATDWYYWYDELASVDPDAYSTAEEYLDAIVEPITSDGTGRDPGFSYLTTITDDEARFTSGAYYGFGFRYTLLNDNQDFYFSDTFEGAPAHLAGLRRAQRLLAVDMGSGFESWESLVARGAPNSEVFGPSDTPVTRIFRVNDAGTERDIEVTKAEVTTPPLVVNTDNPSDLSASGAFLIEREGLSPAGYLHFRSFIDAADGPLRDAARVFAANGVSDLVIDLRYNGGGLVRVAGTFLNLLGGEVADGDLSYIMNFNDKRQDRNQSANFGPEPETFTPLRIAFITRDGTASASEMLINGLDPHVEVVMVGEDTYGKAVGQSAFDLGGGCETRLRLISFEIQNGEGQGGYYTGLASTGRFDLYSASDDVTRPFGDPEEASLKAALGWLNGTLSGKSPSKDENEVGVSRAVAGFEAEWPVSKRPPLNPDGSVRSF